MKNNLFQEITPAISSLDDLAKCADYSLMDTLNCDPQVKENGADHAPRQAFMR
jgi:hypothetical protein